MRNATFSEVGMAHCERADWIWAVERERVERSEDFESRRRRARRVVERRGDEVGRRL